MPIEREAAMMWDTLLDTLIGLLGASLVDDVCRNHDSAPGYPAGWITTKPELQQLETAIAIHLQERKK
jgi:hypothetical protein